MWLWSGHTHTTCLWKALDLPFTKNYRKGGKPCILILGANAVHILDLRERRNVMTDRTEVRAGVETDSF